MFNLNVSLLKYALIINNCAICIVWYVIEDIHLYISQKNIS